MAAEIAAVAKAVRPLGTTEAARAAGFSPVFGWIPTMGEHWVNRPAMRNKPTDMLAPDNLMFSRIGGRDSLVGAAYAYYAPANDSARPPIFGGAPAWHEHANLAPPGQSLVMLHVWFVPSPDGPFAGTNPNLPFWAAGLDAPDATRMRDRAFASRVRRAALALAEVADTTAIFANLERRPAVHEAIAPRRDSIRAIVPELRQAQRARDTARIDALTERLATQWDAMFATYRSAAITPDGRRRIDDFIAMLMSDHGDHAH
ncbi:MAG: hypothetical protein ABJA80_01175 [bacterium]